MYLGAFNRAKNIADSEENEINFELVIRRDGNTPLVNFGDLYLPTGDGWNPYNSMGELKLFSYERLLSGNAQIRAPHSGHLIATVDEEKNTHLKFTVNFEREVITFFDDNGLIITEDSLILPQKALDNGIDSLGELKQYFMMKTISWQAREDVSDIGSKIRLYNLKVYEGALR